MDITREHIDDLNAVVKVAITKDDYSNKVDKILNNYRKNINLPGFRKGHVPMGVVKKQYGKAVVLEEVNKLVQNGLSNYFAEEKLDVLGNPIPKSNEEINWDAEDFYFEFELGLAPEFEVNLKQKKTIPHYKIVADERMITDQVKSLQKKYGKLIAKNAVEEEEDEVTGTFKIEDKELSQKGTFPVNRVKGKKNLKTFMDAKVNDVLTLKTKDLFINNNDLATLLKIDKKAAKDLDVEVTFTVEEVNKRELAELNQEFFDKIFGENQVTSEEELKEKIKEDTEKQFEQQADHKLLNDVSAFLIENTTFELPGNFIKKWLQKGGDIPLTEEQAEEKYEQSEKGLRFQLIEGKIIKENNLMVTPADIKEYTVNYIKSQMSRFDQEMTDEDIESIAAKLMSNEQEVKRISDQLQSEKLLNFYKENANLKQKEVTYDEFLKQLYS